MKPTPGPTATTAAISTPTCSPPTDGGCQHKEQAGINAVGIFVACAAAVLFLAWATSKKRGN